jgi:3-phenylpropionate/trans-cinnamate dioxygenase ferredoxin component
MADMQRAAALEDIPAIGVLALELDGVDLALVKCEDDEVFAIHNECSHASVALSEGEVEGCEIECWLHGSMFDLRTGKPTNLPATEPVDIYPVKVEDGAVYVDVHHPLNTETS